MMHIAKGTTAGAATDAGAAALSVAQELGLPGWSHATVDRMVGTVSAVMRACVRWRYLEYAPPVPMFRPRSGEPRWLTRDKFERLCQELPEHLKLAARFAVFSMLRMRAMLRLTWDRVDLAAKRAWVPSSHQRPRARLASRCPTS
jgi:integrase